MLVSFLIAASVGAGFAQAPWWFWLVGGAALAFLSLTDPLKLRPAYAALGQTGTLALHAVFSLTLSYVASAGAFAFGRMLWWALVA
jgi:hypothetical protein